MKFNSDTFLSSFRAAIKKPLSSTQVKGLTFLLNKIESDPGWGAENSTNDGTEYVFDLRQIAYFLATVWHETNATFQPIKENRESTGSPRRAKQDRYWKTGYYGRGYVQITWKTNYQKFGITNTPDDALKPEVAYNIASRGMREGMFTGAKLSDFFSFSPDKEDFLGARTVVNGRDRAEAIADKARKMQACLSLALVKAPLEELKVPEVSPPAALPIENASSLGVSGVKTYAEKAREAYSKASESEKAVVARVSQIIWTVILGVLAFIQKYPIHTAVVVLVLLLGFWALHSYGKRQDQKTTLKLINK